MNCKIEKSKLVGKITCPANKSYTHRAIFLAALSDGKSIVKKILRSNDTIATINACRGFGVEVEVIENNLKMHLRNHVNLQRIQIIGMQEYSIELQQPQF